MNKLLLTLVFLLCLSTPAFAQLVGTDIKPGDACTAAEEGHVARNASADRDTSEITLICDGSVWQSATGGGGTDTLAGLSCSNGQIAKWNGTTWACAADDAGALSDNAVTNAKMADDAVGIAELSATGTASATTYLRGDNTWTTVPSGADNLGNHTATQTLAMGGFDVSNVRQLLGGFGSLSTGGTLDWNDVSNARSGSGYSLLYGSATNGPGPVTYFYPFSFEYATKDGSGNLTQLAIPYGNDSTLDSGLFIRGRYQGTWATWRKILTENALGNISVTNALSADSFAGSGASLTALNASNLATGTVAAARMPALTGDVTMTAGTTVTNIAADTVGLTELSATGTPSATTFLRGDNTWATVAGGGGGGTGDIYRSDWTTVASGNSYTFPHGLGVVPDFVQVHVKNNTTGFTSVLSSQYAYGYSTYSGASYTKIDATNVVVNFLNVNNFGTDGDGTSLTFAEAKIQVVAMYGTGGSGSGTDTLAGLTCTTGQVAAWNGTAWACSSSADGGTGVVPGWPDVIRCTYSAGEMYLPILYNYTTSAAMRYASDGTGSAFMIGFNPSTKTYVSHINMTGSNCLNKSIADLYASGQAYNFGGGGSGTDTLAGLSCSNGQIAKWNGTIWACAADDAAALADNAVTNAKMADDAVGVAELSATGTASATTYLRGDNTWAAPPAGGISTATTRTCSHTSGSNCTVSCLAGEIRTGCHTNSGPGYAAPSGAAGCACSTTQMTAQTCYAICVQ